MVVIMNKYRVHFVPLIGDCETVSLMAIDRDDAITTAIDIAQDPDSLHDPENCTRFDLVLLDGQWQHCEQCDML
jgi:hypothetical protein